MEYDPFLIQGALGLEPGDQDPYLNDIGKVPFPK